MKKAIVLGKSSCFLPMEQKLGYIIWVISTIVPLWEHKLAVKTFEQKPNTWFKWWRNVSFQNRDYIVQLKC